MSWPEVLQILVAVLGAGGVAGGFWSIISTRHKPAIDRQQADDATKKANADIVTQQLQGLTTILEQYREERKNDREEVLKLRDEVRLLRTEIETLMAVDALRKGAFQAALDHIQDLEDHINNQLAPPPPKRPDGLTQADY